MAFRLAARARRDLEEILRFSAREFGHEAADRYQLLLTTVLQEIGEQPALPGWRPVRRRPELRIYAVAHSRTHVPSDLRVRHPAHRVVYALGRDGVVEILAIIGDRYPATRVRRPRQPG